MNALRLFVIVVFVAILVSLGQALYLLAIARDAPERSAKLGRALLWRVLLSIALFALLLLAWRFGLIAPHELGR